jgi:hypothetical protein
MQLIPYPVWIVTAQWILRGERFIDGVVLSVIGAGAFWAWTWERIRLDSRGAARVRGWPKRSVEWTDIARVIATSGGIYAGLTGSNSLRLS